MSHTIGLTFAALVMSMTCASAASANEIIAYAYDARGRLIKVEQIKAGDDRQTCYTYDKAGNRTNVKTEINLLPDCP